MNLKTSHSYYQPICPPLSQAHKEARVSLIRQGREVRGEETILPASSGHSRSPEQLKAENLGYGYPGFSPSPRWWYDLEQIIAIL